MRRGILVAACLLFLAVGAHAQVVVELFTSQGCSDCPPADELLHALRSDPHVIPISFHVDYWDGATWKDPFSDHEWTLRQAAYVKSMRLKTAYTPQIVVDGKRQMVGSDSAAVHAAIAQEVAANHSASVDIDRTNGVAMVHTRSDRPGLDLILVTESDEAPTSVKGGENAGHVLEGDCVARRLSRVRNIAAGDHVERVKVRGERIVAMLQDPTTLEIYAAAMK